MIWLIFVVFSPFGVTLQACFDDCEPSIHSENRHGVFGVGLFFIWS